MASKKNYIFTLIRALQKAKESPEKYEGLSKGLPSVSDIASEGIKMYDHFARGIDTDWIRKDASCAVYTGSKEVETKAAGDYALSKRDYGVAFAIYSGAGLLARNKAVMNAVKNAIENDANARKVLEKELKFVAETKRKAKEYVKKGDYWSAYRAFFTIGEHKKAAKFHEKVIKEEEKGYKLRRRRYSAPA